VWLKQQEDEAFGKVGAVVGPAHMGHVTMIELEVARLRMLERSLLKGDAANFGCLVTRRRVTAPFLCFGVVRRRSSMGLPNQWLREGGISVLRRELKRKHVRG
jgi:hypothetical protein